MCPFEIKVQSVDVEHKLLVISSISCFRSKLQQLDFLYIQRI